MKMRKLVAMLMAVMMLMCIIPFSAAAESNSATIDFTDKANRVSYTAEQQVWAQNGITVTNNKGASTSNVGDYGGEGYPARFYKSSTVTIEYPGMTHIVIDCGDLEAKYINGWKDSVSAGADAGVNGSYVVITLAKAADSFTWETLTAQSRAYKIVAYSLEEGDAPVIPDAPVTPPDIPVDPPVGPEGVLTIEEAIALGLSMEHNVFTEEKYFVTGVITEVYNTQYGNMRLTDENGNILTIYGTYSADGEIRYDVLEVKPVAGDTVTIYGIVGQYNGTAQIKNGWIVEHIPGEGTVTPPDVPVDPPVGDVLTIEEAIALGLSMEHNVFTEEKYTVTGVITEVYNTQYGNMKLTDENGNILTIYGTWSADGEIRYDALETKPVAGDTVTIYGIVGQYNGTAQIKNGWIVEHIPGEGTVTPPDVPVEPPVSGDFVTITFDDLANRLSVSTEQQVWSMNGITVINDKGASTSNVNEKYFAPIRFYKNSDVTVEYPGMTKIVFHCNTASYASALADAIGVTAEDTLVTVELAGVDSYVCTMTAGQVRVDSIDVYSGEGGGDTPVEPPVTDDELTIEEAIALGLAMDHNTYTDGKYYVSGVITEVYNTQYGNMKLTDEAGNILTIYGTYSADGEIRYDALETKPVAGDTVTIYGIVGQYNGTAQIKNGWIVEHIPGEGTVTPPDVPVDPPVGDIPEPVVNPVAGVPYHLGLHQTAKGAVYYFTGAMSGFYGATETDMAAAVTVYLEDAEGGYKMYFQDDSGAKMYVKLEQSGTHYNFTFGAEGSVFTLDTELNALCAPCGDQICYMGTYGNYVTIGCLTTEKLSDTDYIARLYAVEGDTPVDPPVEYVGSIVASTAEGSVGNTVNVTVSLTDNPGLISAKVKVLYDSAVLKLVGYEAGNFAAGGYSWGDIEKADGSFIINWCDAINPDSTADLLATLTFEVLEGAEDGFTPITLQFDCDGDMFNAAGDAIWFDAVNGGVEIVTKSYTLGDLDGNGRINNRDLGMLQQHLNEWPVNINTDAADLDANGRINNRDLGMLQQYINEWDVEFG